MSEPEHIKSILKRIFQQLEKDLGNNKGGNIETEIKADNSLVAE